jgi:hypothetical protein
VRAKFDGVGHGGIQVVDVVERLAAGSQGAVTWRSIFFKLFAQRKTRHRGIFKVGWVFTFTAAAYNFLRMRNLLFPPLQSA